MTDSYQTQSILKIGDNSYTIYDLNKLPNVNLDRLPYSLKILLENQLRKEDGRQVTQADIDAICQWQPEAIPTATVNFTPARVVLQDFTGVPAIVDLAAMRDAIVKLGGDADQINPLEPVDLVIDHSVMVDHFGTPDAMRQNTDIEFERNYERYRFLRWGQKAFQNFRVVPPGTGIVHQVNLEYLADVVTQRETHSGQLLYPDTLVGTDSHTTMINGLGVLGWGVGGIEAEAGMLGQPVSMLLPQVVGFKLRGSLQEGTTATDLVLTVTEILRARGVVGKFVEFYGDGLSNLPLADRATIANMAPEYGATCGIFPIDQETVRYLHLSGRDEKHIQMIEAYARHQGLWREDGGAEADYSDHLELDLSDVVPSIAGPKRPQDRIPLQQAHSAYREHMELMGTPISEDSVDRFAGEGGHTAIGADSDKEDIQTPYDATPDERPLRNGDVVIAAITSCTNTSNPAVMIAAGLVARKATELGLTTKPWVKTSLAPGSQVVPGYLTNAGLLEPLEKLGFDVVGFGCTTCIGNSGPLPEEVSEEINAGDLNVCSVLSGNRNFEGRIHQEVKSNYLASPPLVVLYALAGSMLIDVFKDPIGVNGEGDAIYLKDLWPSQSEINELVAKAISAPLYKERYADVFQGTDAWQQLPVEEGQTYNWPASTYINNPPYFDGMTSEPSALQAVTDARCLVKVGDSITTDHISPAGAIKPDSPAGQYLQSQDVEPKDFNSLGSRRGNHEVMMRGTFANTRLRNQLAPGTEGGYTRLLPGDKVMSIYDAAMTYAKDHIPLVVLAGKEYGTGSSRDWAAKGTKLLGVQVVIAESFERIHRSNLVQFGVLPLQFVDGESVETLGLSGEETFSFDSVDEEPETISVTATNSAGETKTFTAKVRIDTPAEWDYYRHGGILQYVLRNLAAQK